MASAGGCPLELGLEGRDTAVGAPPTAACRPPDCLAFILVTSAHDSNHHQGTSHHLFDQGSFRMIFIYFYIYLKINPERNKKKKNISKHLLNTTRLLLQKSRAIAYQDSIYVTNRETHRRIIKLCENNLQKNDGTRISILQLWSQ